ncbi:hypothetical protein OPV22_034256 [Ensete ventricosum]|uniref:NB-ARC domain-containing protein n=1 Tax=Ensete ventricosum TaxID=4639 RepID=A0AAV8PU24_ENSVE|nr:hypothetical protein OPV22_034256 [Ensete ventricosum]
MSKMDHGLGQKLVVSREPVFIWMHEIEEDYVKQIVFIDLRTCIKYRSLFLGRCMRRDDDLADEINQIADSAEFSDRKLTTCTGLGKQGLEDMLGFNKAAAFDRVAFMSVDFVMLEGFMSTQLQCWGPSKLASLLSEKMDLQLPLGYRKLQLLILMELDNHVKILVERDWKEWVVTKHSKIDMLKKKMLGRRQW